MHPHAAHRNVLAIVCLLLCAGLARGDEPIGTGLVGCRGYRNDWTGRYLDANPVTAFDIEKGINVLWRVPTSRFGNSTPLILGNRLMFIIEPFTVVCLDKMTGKVLWTSAGSEPSAYAPLFTVDKEAPLWSKRSLKYGEHGGNTYASPVTDGKRIWYKGRGAARCFDPETGRELWATDLHLAPGDHPHCVPSPLLVGKVLVCQGGLSDYWEKNSTNKLAPGVLPRSKFPKSRQWMVGLDADTGRILWDIGPLNGGGYNVGGTPAPLVVQEGGQRRLYIMAAEGHVIRPEDGKLVLPYAGARNASLAPVPLGSRILFGSALVELGINAQARLAVLKSTPVPGEGAGVYHDGLLYLGYRTPDRTTRLMSVFDTRTSRMLYEGIQIGADGALMPATFNRADDMDYPTAAMAGRYVFYCTNHAVTVADIGGGGRPWPVAINYVERMHIAPVFDGDRMYLRTYDAMTCIARKGEEGARYEKEANARTVIHAFPAAISDQAAIEPRPAASLSEWVGQPASLHVSGRMPDQWLFAGPFPRMDDADALQAIGGCGRARPVPGQKVSHGGKELAFTAVDPRVLQKDGLDIDGLTRKDRDGQSFLFTWLVVGDPQFASCNAKPPIRVWIGGEELAPGRVARLAMGAYPVMVRLAAPERLQKAQKIAVNLAFARAEDPAVTRQKHIALVREGRDRLRMVCETLPGSEEARQAEALLKAAQ